MTSLKNLRSHDATSCFFFSSCLYISHTLISSKARGGQDDAYAHIVHTVSRRHRDMPAARTRDSHLSVRGAMLHTRHACPLRSHSLFLSARLADTRRTHTPPQVVSVPTRTPPHYLAKRGAHPASSTRWQGPLIHTLANPTARTRHARGQNQLDTQSIAQPSRGARNMLDASPPYPHTQVHSTPHRRT